MQTINISQDLSFAVNIIEEIINSKDGEDFIEAIKNYKHTKEIDDFILLKFSEYFI